MKRRGLITNQMKTLIKHIRAMNKRLKKGQIKMTKELRMALPRSLWTVKFPPPLAEVNICDDTCKKISKSIESKRSLLIPVFVLFFTLYILYVLV
ncbi:hypothetical protein M9Y10_037096 [Tritrichomonas musculus]|uniref:Uncharacterized protein n=1 Tax=Tritrichomonas musculus TaxID=1915356 RepID=A0ABR2GT02_9EUKA